MAQGYTSDKINVCVNGSVLFTDTTQVPAGVTVTNRTWNFADATGPIVTTFDTISHVFVTQGSYAVSFTINYSNGTSLSIPNVTPIVVSTRPTGISITPDKPITCPGIPITFTPTYTAGSFGTIANHDLYLGDNSAVKTGVSTPMTFNYSQLGSFTVKYVIIDGGGCSDSAFTKVNIISNPVPKFYTNSPSCRDSISIYINDTKFKDSFISWKWEFFDRTYIQNLSTQNGSMTWKQPKADSNWVVLTGTNQYQCVGTSAKLIVKVDTTPTLVFTPATLDVTICYGESINYKIKNKGGDTIYFDNLLWGTALSRDTLYNLAPKNTMTYTVYTKSPNCPKKGTEIKIKVVQPISTKVVLQPDTMLSGSQSNVKVNINAIYDSIRWSPELGLLCPTCDTTGASPLVTTTYTAKVYYSLGDHVCSVSDSAQLVIDGVCLPTNFAIPTGFTPNGDSKNDIFYLKGFSFRDVKDFNIYSRWGNLVYSAQNVPANDERYGWNGKDKNIGDDMPSGVYVYNIQVTCSNGQLLNFQGEITLLR